MTTHPSRPTFGIPVLRRLTIGSKLALGFGVLVALTLLVIGLNFMAGDEATATINRTDEIRVPAAMVSAQAQSDLLTMFSDVRGYLAFGERRFLLSYRRAEQSFRTRLDQLDALSGYLSPADQQNLEDLKSAFAMWEELPEQLFRLRDDQIAREPAYRWLNTTGSEYTAGAMIGINRMIAEQARRDPSAQNMELLETMSNFQSSFAAMFAGLRGYVTTQNPNFRYYEYELNLASNAEHWEQLTQQVDQLTPTQQQYLEQIRSARQRLIDAVPDEVYAVVEGERQREDLFLFNSQMEPLTIEMQFQLQSIADNQRTALQADLEQGRSGLLSARMQSLMGGGFAVLLGIGMALLFWHIITGPMRRLTGVAHQIEDGDITVMARVESDDEIGMFARTFNNMTAQLGRTLQQIRREKKRADDLLNVVIPIGVALSSERNFNQLLENMLVEAMNFCAADWGSLYLRDGDGLRLMMLRITSQQAFFGGTSSTPVEFEPLALSDAKDDDGAYGDPAIYVATQGLPVNVADINASDLAFDVTSLRAFATRYDYDPVSLLAIPLKNVHNEVLGVLQLINARPAESDQVIPFDENLQQMMLSFSSLAVAALESYVREQSLRQEIQQLRIEIDVSKRQEQVDEIVESDFFQDLRSKARSLRQRNQTTDQTNSDSN